jgi:concanavalin A-like lectin/glucanase superfamily protein
MPSRIAHFVRGAFSALVLGATACGNATPPPPPEELSDPEPHDASFDEALSFDGVDDYASIGTARMPQIERDQTLMLWFLPKASDAKAADEVQTMFALRRSDWSGVSLSLRNAVPLVRNVYSNRDLAIAASAVTLDVWHHLAVVIEAKSTELFIDGVSVSKAAEPGQNRTPIEAYLGTSDGYHQPFHGLLDEIQIYPRSYSADEVAQVAQGIGADEVDPPVLYLPFNEAAGARCYDRSGLDNHAELGDGVLALMPTREPLDTLNKPRAVPAPTP